MDFLALHESAHGTKPTTSASAAIPPAIRNELTFGQDSNEDLTQEEHEHCTQSLPGSGMQ